MPASNEHPMSVLFTYDQKGAPTTDHDALDKFWKIQRYQIEHESINFKTCHQLPLARIKKVMKIDTGVSMIGAEAPVVFSKACEIFILELTLRAWINTGEVKRKTIQRSDIAAAISKSDIFDFLIDIVPRDDSRVLPRKSDSDYMINNVYMDQQCYFPTNPGSFQSTPMNTQDMRMQNDSVMYCHPFPTIPQMAPQQLVGSSHHQDLSRNPLSGKKGHTKMSEPSIMSRGTPHGMSSQTGQHLMMQAPPGISSVHMHMGQGAMQNSGPGPENIVPRKSDSDKHPDIMDASCHRYEGDQTSLSESNSSSDMKSSTMNS